MKVGWKEVKFGEITKNFDGKRKPLSRRVRANFKGEYPYYGACDVIDYVKEYIFDGEYLLIGEDGANLLSKSKPLAFIVNGKFWVNNHAHVVQATEDIDLKFLEYQFNSLQINAYVTGSAQPKLNQRNLNKIPILLPPLPEQQKIVAKIETLFSDLDNGIANLQAAKAKLTVYRQSVLKKAFEGELTKVQMSKSTLGQSCKITMGQSPPSSTYNQEGIGIPLINGPVEFGKSALSHTIKSKWTTKTTKTCEKGDLILCVRGSTTGRTNIAAFNACIGRGVAAIQYAQNQEYLNYYIISIRQKIYSKGTGSTFPSISSQKLKNLEFPLCTIKEQTQIVQAIESRLSVADEVLTTIEASLAKAEALRQSVLKAAFEGKLV